MTDRQNFAEFLATVEAVREDDPIRMTAHTSNAATEDWPPTAATEPETQS
ncbi:hypothetical protein [Streptomyces sp. NPDC054797]